MKRLERAGGVSMSYWGVVLSDNDDQQLTGSLLKDPPSCFAIIYSL